MPQKNGSNTESFPSNVAREQRLNIAEGRQTKIPKYSFALEKYVHESCFNVHPILARIRLESVHEEMNYMMTGPDQAALLSMLVKISGAKRILEVGCYLGYSTIAMAAAMDNKGTLISLDHNLDWSQKAKAYFREAGLEARIDLRTGEALDLLDVITSEIEEGSEKFDFIFIDADKKNVFNYYLACVDMLSPGALLLVDNVLWRGHILDENDDSERVKALRALNQYVQLDERVESMVLTLSDGMLLVRKK